MSRPIPDAVVDRIEAALRASATPDAAAIAAEHGVSLRTVYAYAQRRGVTLPPRGPRPGRSPLQQQIAAALAEGLPIAQIVSDLGCTPGYVTRIRRLIASDGEDENCTYVQN